MPILRPPKFTKNSYSLPKELLEEVMATFAVAQVQSPSPTMRGASLLIEKIIAEIHKQEEI
jgi:hypothetical protein